MTEVVSGFFKAAQWGFSSFPHCCGFLLGKAVPFGFLSAIQLLVAEESMEGSLRKLVLQARTRCTIVKTTMMAWT